MRPDFEELLVSSRLLIVAFWIASRLSGFGADVTMLCDANTDRRARSAVRCVLLAYSNRLGDLPWKVQ